jgi:hypothetical protein
MITTIQIKLYNQTTVLEKMLGKQSYNIFIFFNMVDTDFMPNLGQEFDKKK